MDEKISVRGRDLFVVMRKFPLSSLKVPASVPFISIETEGTISFVFEFLTLPERIVFCANADETENESKKSIPMVSA
jgi:hypothetical protein